jgi:K+-transporting ATPase KdpF subunit
MIFGDRRFHCEQGHVAMDSLKDDSAPSAATGPVAKGAVYEIPTSAPAVLAPPLSPPAYDSLTELSRSMEVPDGFHLHRRNRAHVSADGRSCRWLRQAGRVAMSWLYLSSGIVAVGLLVYLVVALVNAEKL